VNFNIGMVTKSIQIKSQDLLKILLPTLTSDFSKA